MLGRAVLLAAALAAALTAVASSAAAADGVILLHGLCRTDRSMAAMAQALAAEGFVVVNVDYPSREATIDELAASTIAAALGQPALAGVDRIHFVTHSLGGILVRRYLKDHAVDRLGRVVMLGPPNAGSEVVDALGDYQFFTLINGPAGRQLGTGPDSVPLLLGAAAFDLGVIAGDRSINWINSRIIPGPDDGKVSVERTRLAGMRDHLVLHAAHPFLAGNRAVILQTVHYLRHGKFSRGQ